MQGEIKREDAGRITKRLLECRMHLQKQNVYSCLTTFRDVLEKVGTTRMLPADAKQLHQDINTFQYDLSVSRAFRHLYGPVTFKDDDVETALDFMKQLLQIKDEEIAETMAEQSPLESRDGQSDLRARVREIELLVEKGEYDTARTTAAQDEAAADALIEGYNSAGIRHRKEKAYDKAVTAFKKALFVRPEDEGLHYNLARVYIEADDWKSAKNTMEEILQSQPDFPEGQRLLQHIDTKMIEEGHA
jgi:tetratricopeptide (TPR) repeat protein